MQAQRIREPVADASNAGAKNLRGLAISTEAGESYEDLRYSAPGAIGGYMAGELALAGHEVCAIARGAHLAAIRSHGLKLIIEGKTRTVDLPASDDAAAFGAQDVVICALGHSLVVFLQGARLSGWPSFGKRRCRRRAMERDWTRARHRVCRRSRLRGSGARGDRTSAVQALHHRRARRLHLGPHRGPARCLGVGWPNYPWAPT
jgi:hypothetical protein